MEAHDSSQPNRIYCTCKSTCSTKRTSTEVSCGQDCKCGSQSKPCRNKDCIQTLDEPMVHKLCVRSLQCGLGSMDYIHSLLIMDDDNDSDTESEHFDVYRETPQESESTDSQHASAVAGPAPNPSAASNSLPWCKCSFCIVVVREDVLQHLQGSASFVSTQMC
ncbi:hypothetical protein ABFA07_019245 [Porites harrisoni]